LKFIFLSLVLFLFTACGYKPTSYYAKNEIAGKVFVKLNVDIRNATNSVFIKDAVNEMVVNQFGATLTNNKEIANTLINISLGDVSFSALQYDSRGYAKLYRTTISINLNYSYKNNENKMTNRTLSVSGSYDYSVDDDSLITEAKKQESVKIAAQRALDEIFSKIAIESFKDDEKDNSIKEKLEIQDVNEPTKSKSFFFFN